MPYRIEQFYPGGFYHVFNRGIDCQRIFFSTDNYLHCLNLLKKYSHLYNISMIVWCLMPNHYHLVLRQNSSNNISELMQVVFNAYVQAVNKKIRRRGPLFEGRFKHIHIDDNTYILHLCRYIHLNPVKAKLASSPEMWPYSNYSEWIGYRKLDDPAIVTSLIGDSQQYQQFVLEYMIENKTEGKLEKYILE